MPRLFIIDDRDRTVEMCHRHLGQFDYVTRCERNIPCQVCDQRDRGCPLKCAHDYGEAQETLARLPALPDLVVLDLHFALPEERLLPEAKEALPAEARARTAAVEELRRRQGLLILERLRHDYPTLPVVMLTTTDATVGAHPDDPLVYFCENEIVDSRTLAAEITRALTLHHTAQEGSVFWGRSRPMVELRHQLEILARSPLPLLLTGETGTGKSYLAEHVVHPRSAAKGPFVVTDLSTVPPTILPAHLFGSRRGAYTGSTEDHPGVFEQAHGGTLLLDEIGNLDLDLQRQLLLVLERGTVTRLGDTRPRPARCKLVAATNQDLVALVAQGRFRSDLYMRLNPAARLRVPPLRERREDLPDLLRFAVLDALRSEALRPLTRDFLARFPTPEDFHEEESVVVFGKPAVRAARRDAFSVFLSREALGSLVSHPWPGNHRELRLFAVNALVLVLVQHLDVEPRPTERAPAILSLPDHLVYRLLRELVPPAAAPRAEAAPPAEGAAGGDGAPRPAMRGNRIEVEVRPGPSFSKVSIDVERQYMQALFDAAGGDLEQMAPLLLGPRGSARQVHLRLNQLGLKLRELRGRR
jgi:DNA-binding NtrC family response regulator